MIWLDAHISPALAVWISQQIGHPALPLRELGLRVAKDEAIFEQARDVGAIVMTKDEDFVKILERRGPPPQIVWLTCGNTSNASLQTILLRRLPKALELIARGEPLVEISD